MTRRMRMAALAVLTAAIVALTGCGGLPTAGPVNPGLEAGGAPGVPDVDFLPAGPQPGASPEDIVRGFIDAATSPTGTWERARLFLAADYADEWEPRAGVTIDELGDRTFTVSEDAVELTLAPVADVDSSGAYRLSEAESGTVGYSLAQGGDGEWRITNAPNGIILDTDSFSAVYRAYELMYFDPDWTHLVPDVRWYPRASAVNRIASALINGSPSPWLAASVSNAFPEAVELAPGGVTFREGVAQIELPPSVLGSDTTTLSRMRLQLSASLQTAGVSSVALLVDGAEVEVEQAEVASVTVDPRALVRTEDAFGYLDGGEVARVPLSAVIEETSATRIAIGREGTTAALRLDDESVARVELGGTLQIVDDRRGLIAPIIDEKGSVWSVPADDPTELIVVDSDGIERPMGGDWAGASRVDAMRLSPDGTRLAAAIVVGGSHWLVVSGVVRNSSDGQAAGLGEQLRLARLAGPAIDVAWTDEKTIAAAVDIADGTQVIEQTVGGPGTSSVAPVEGVESIAAGNSATAVRLLSTDGGLYSRRGTGWQETASSIEVLAHTLGG